MNKALAFKEIYPEAMTGIDFEVQIDSYGKQVIIILNDKYKIPTEKKLKSIFKVMQKKRKAQQVEDKKKLDMHKALGVTNQADMIEKLVNTTIEAVVSGDITKLKEIQELIKGSERKRK